MRIVFEWDEGNRTKSWIKHRVSRKETQEAFCYPKAKQFKDIKHSTRIENRFVLYSQTRKGRCLYISFTIRKGKVRPISSRPMNRKERLSYEKAISSA